MITIKTSYSGTEQTKEKPLVEKHLALHPSLRHDPPIAHSLVKTVKVHVSSAKVKGSFYVTIDGHLDGHVLAEQRQGAASGV